MMRSAVRPLLPDKGDHEAVTFPKLAEDGKLLVYKTERFWRAVDTVKEIEIFNRSEESYGYVFYVLQRI